MSFHFRLFQNTDTETLQKYIQELYSLDIAELPITSENINKTIHYFFEHPESGEIYIFESETSLIGYAIVVNFWSNEYAGITLRVDEIYVIDNFRRQGVARSFFEYLSNKYQGKAIGIGLEVLPSNIRALESFKKNGFKKLEYALLFRLID